MVGRIGRKFLIATSCCVAVFGALIAYSNWSGTRRCLEQSADSSIELALAFDLAIRDQVTAEIRPLVEEHVPHDAFYPEAMSSSYVARSVFERVRQRSPDYVIKFASDNPFNPVNAATPAEQEVLDRFRSNPELRHWQGTLSIEGRDYIAMAVPRRMGRPCMRCHGNPQDAPAAILSRYGAEGGFGRREGDVAAIDLVALPKDSIEGPLSAQARRDLPLIGMAASAVLVSTLLIFRRLVGRRLAAISKAFRRAAMQADGAPIEAIENVQRDEIGELVESFNLLASRLRDHQTRLEEKVAERTRALADEVAERRRAQETAAEGERRLRMVGDHVGDVIWMADMDLRWHYISRSIEQLTGYTAEESLRLALEETITAESCRRALDVYREAIAEAADPAADPKSVGEPAVLEVEYRCKDGSTVWAEVRAAITLDSDGRPTGIVGVSRNIAQRKQLESSLEAGRQFAEAASRAKSEFLANMSHEIRTPMTAILGYIDLLADGCQGLCSFGREKGDDYISILRRNGEQLLELINNILDLSKIEAGKLVVQTAACSPAAIAAEVAATLRVRAEAKDLALRVAQEGRLPEAISTDPCRLRQILVNLVGNAIKFTETGEVVVALRLRAEDPRAARIEFEVRDTGVGISPEHLATVFEPFSQGDASTTRRFGGTGLGLTISRRLAETLGGTLRVESAPGRGSSFFVELPAGPVESLTFAAAEGDAPAVPPAPASNAAPASNNVAAAPAPPLSGRVLLAEDGPDNQRLLSLFLRKAGLAVVVVDNGAAALEAALSAESQQQPFDLVLMDMQMPVMDGYEATRRLRAAGFARTVVALTAHAMTEDRRRCIDAGCDDYLTKPIERTTLVEAVRGHLAKTRAAAIP